MISLPLVWRNGKVLNDYTLRPGLILALGVFLSLNAIIKLQIFKTTVKRFEK